MGGNQTRDDSHKLAKGTPCGFSARDVSAEDQWRLVGGGAVQVDGRSVPRQVGGEKRVK